jgi:hypothetical protein
LTHYLLGTLAIRFIDDEDIGNFEHSSLNALYIVTQPWYLHDNCGMGGACDLHLALAGTDRFNQHQVKAGSIEKRGRISRGP